MSAFIGQSLLIVCLVVLLLMGTCRAEDDLKNWLDHCSARNQTNPDSFLGRTACTLNCMRHYQIKDGKVSDDGLVCATDMQFACRDGLCRTGSQSTLVLDNVYNKGLDDIKISLNSSKSYFTICLGDLTKGQTIHDVQLPFLDRKHCRKCAFVNNKKLVCDGLDQWNWHQTTSIIVIESWTQIEANSDAFVGGTVSRFPDVVPEGQRVSSYHYQMETDSHGNIHHALQLVWHNV